ncbi:MAG TPA: MipA/OmpV family protein [Azospirillaceae bacterium]|nr:MipA/OmpV family protein [Azospirillaceae bacterium]
MKVLKYAALALFLVPAAAQAQRPAERTGDWQVSLGAAAIVGPEYPGAKDYRVLPVPSLEVTWRDRVFLNARDGLGVNLLTGGDGLRAGAALHARFGRDDGDDRVRLRGMGDIDAAPQLRLFAEQRIDQISLSATLARDFGGGDGTTLELGARWFQPLGGGTALTLGPTLALGDGKFARTWFGVSERQARVGERARYDADAGIHSVGFGGGVIHPLSERWTLALFGGYDRLVGDAADSPVVAREGAFTGALSLSYGF